MTTQDLVKTIDITGLSVVTGSEMDQLVDTARTAVDKGLILYSVDTGVNVPDVPNPATADGMGIVPIWWKRYIWIRIPNVADGVGQVFAYGWNPNLVSDALYLKWQNLGQRGIDAYILAGIAGTNATNAQTTATAAQTASTNAVNQANSALALAGQANDTANIAQQTADDAKTKIAQTFLTGEIRMYAGPTTRFPDDQDTGWLNCGGQAVSRTLFAGLYAIIGITYGAGDGVATFNVPNGLSRSPIGAGQGTGLSARVLGSVYGEESVTLTAAQSGLPLHSHSTAYDQAQADGNTRAANMLVASPLAGGTALLNSTNTGGTDATQAHDNMPPVFAVRFIIKT